MLHKFLFILVLLQEEKDFETFSENYSIHSILNIIFFLTRKKMFAEIEAGHFEDASPLPEETKLKVDIPLGTIINGYQFLEMIGSGASADVYKVRHTRFGSIYCAKVMTIKSKQESENRMQQKFDVELQSLMKLDHPNIIRLYDYFCNESIFVIILEYCSGGTLADEIARSDGGLNECRLEEIIQQLLSAVAYAHSEGVVHRDIKPENVLIDAFGRAKLADFGISAIQAKIGDVDEMSTNRMCSILYAPPELLKRIPHNERAADIWSLGQTFLECYTGEPVFEGTKSDVIRSILIGNFAIPVGGNFMIEKLVRKMTSLDPSERPTAEQLLGDVNIQTKTKIRPQYKSLGVLPPLASSKKDSPMSIRSSMIFQIKKKNLRRKSINFTFKE
ncbi:Aurora kinase B [Tritrichomonas foetus]|uniref:Aurora kinase B n=1 Tax=Tritrichomonas foetus TaxID=1144522 RepID=A0A1J4KGB6_9EUKA|nr:Aurora kinase B [Tritrichomonas foetus]|eukprot:OHT10447.1 Aurora kinase B [Tritrichomonas foetus]